jgi:hypothetical protein
MYSCSRSVRREYVRDEQSRQDAKGQRTSHGKSRQQNTHVRSLGWQDDDYQATAPRRSHTNCDVAQDVDTAARTKFTFTRSDE